MSAVLLLEGQVSLQGLKNLKTNFCNEDYMKVNELEIILKELNSEFPAYLRIIDFFNFLLSAFAWIIVIFGHIMSPNLLLYYVIFLVIALIMNYMTHQQFKKTPMRLQKAVDNLNSMELLNEFKVKVNVKKANRNYNFEIEVESARLALDLVHPPPVYEYSDVAIDIEEELALPPPAYCPN